MAVYLLFIRRAVCCYSQDITLDKMFAHVDVFSCITIQDNLVHILLMTYADTTNIVCWRSGTCDDGMISFQCG